MELEVVVLALRRYLVLVFGLVFYGQGSPSREALLAQWSPGQAPVKSGDL